MSSNRGLKEHEDIIADILSQCRERSTINTEQTTDERNLRDAKQILSNQEDLINRLKSIEAELNQTSIVNT